MKKFRVCIEEIVSDEFEVEATNEKEAIEITRERYKNGEFVLEPGNLEDVKFGVVKCNELQFTD